MSTETMAVDREALARWFHNGGIKNVGQTQPDAVAYRNADSLLASGILRDAAAVRHEHGERIAKAIVEMPHKCVAATYAADIARDLSPPP